MTTVQEEVENLQAFIRQNPNAFNRQGGMRLTNSLDSEHIPRTGNYMRVTIPGEDGPSIQFSAAAWNAFMEQEATGLIRAAQDNLNGAYVDMHAARQVRIAEARRQSDMQNPNRNAGIVRGDGPPAMVRPIPPGIIGGNAKGPGR